MADFAGVMNMRQFLVHRLDTIERASRLFHCLPLEFRELIEKKPVDDPAHEIAMTLANMPPEARLDLKTETLATLDTVDRFLDSMTTQTMGHTLSDDERHLLQEMVAGVFGLRPRARRDLARFFDTMVAGETVFLVCKAHDGTFDAAMTQTMPAETLKMLGLFPPPSTRTRSGRQRRGGEGEEDD